MGGAIDGTPNRGWTDGYIARMTADGSVLAFHQFGTEQIDYPRDIVHQDGRLYVAGMTEGSLVEPNSGGVDVFVATFDPTVLEAPSIAGDFWIFY